MNQHTNLAESTDLSEAEIYDALRSFLKSTISLFEPFRATVPAITELVREIAVELAMERQLAESPVQGSKINLAELSWRTGINGRQLKPIVARLDEGHDLDMHALNPETRIIEVWAQSDEYRDENGQPMELAIRGPGKTFQYLCRSVLSGGSYERLLDSLLSAGCVEVFLHGTKERFVRLKELDFKPAWDDAIKRLAITAQAQKHFLATLKHNVWIEGDPGDEANEDKELYQLSMWSDRIPEDQKMEILRLLKGISREAMAGAKEQLIEAENSFGDERPAHRAGIGIYTFHEPLAKPD